MPGQDWANAAYSATYSLVGVLESERWCLGKVAPLPQSGVGPAAGPARQFAFAMKSFCRCCPRIASSLFKETRGKDAGFAIADFGQERLGDNGVYDRK